MKMRYDYETMKKSRNYVKKSRSYLHIIFHNQISQFSNVAVYKFFVEFQLIIFNATPPHQSISGHTVSNWLFSLGSQLRQ